MQTPPLTATTAAVLLTLSDSQTAYRLLEALHKFISISENPPIPPVEPEPIDGEEVERMLGISPVTRNDWSNKGILTRHRLGGRVYYFRHEILEAMQGQQNAQRSTKRQQKAASK